MNAHTLQVEMEPRRRFTLMYSQSIRTCLQYLKNFRHKHIHTSIFQGNIPSQLHQKTVYRPAFYQSPFLQYQSIRGPAKLQATPTAGSVSAPLNPTADQYVP